MPKSRQKDAEKAKLLRPRDRESTEQRLLQAGLEVFSELGYEGATTKLIAERASSNEALISRYFKNKEGLLLAIIVKYISEKKAVELAYPPSDSLETELCRYLRTNAERDIKFKDFIRIIISRASIDPTLVDRIRSHVSLDPDPELLVRLKRFQDRGILPADADLNQISFSVGFQGFATVSMAHIILGKDRDETLKALHEFAKVYARGLQAK